MSEIKFSPEAILDLREIKEYISEELSNEQASDRIIEKVFKRIRTLSEFPNSGAELSSIVDIDSEYRFLVCGNYTAFYRYENDIVYIIRILYGRRDFMRILFGNKDDN